MREDGAALISYPTTTNATAYASANGWTGPPPLDLFPIPEGTNQTLELFNSSARYATDYMFRCLGAATVYSGLENGLWDEVYYYEFERSYQLTYFLGHDCQPPSTADHPNGDPSKPYFRCHSGELYQVFGNIAFQGLPPRDNYDLPFEQMVVDAWAAFARTYDPNPDADFLKARGYSNTTTILAHEGKWSPATKDNLTLRALAWPPYQAVFREMAQCDGIGLPFDVLSVKAGNDVTVNYR